jgi:Na+/melibiose symporter-like transporter
MGAESADFFFDCWRLKMSFTIWSALFLAVAMATALFIYLNKQKVRIMEMALQ